MCPLHYCLIQGSWLLNGGVSHVERETTELCSCPIFRSKSTVLSVNSRAFLAFGNTEVFDQALPEIKINFNSVQNLTLRFLILHSQKRFENIS
jgi:hypothetical protein